MMSTQERTPYQKIEDEVRDELGERAHLTEIREEVTARWAKAYTEIVRQVKAENLQRTDHYKGEETLREIMRRWSIFKGETPAEVAAPVLPKVAAQTTPPIRPLSPLKRGIRRPGKESVPLGTKKR